jgi:hypothetical protein
MESVVRNVKTLDFEERRVYEAVLGHPLDENQRVVISLIEGDTEEATRRSALSRAVEIARHGRASAEEMHNLTSDEADARIDEAIHAVRRSRQ